MGFGNNLPPFCIAESNSGVEVDIIREALAFRGHVLRPVFYPIKRVPRYFIEKKIDAAMMDSGMNLIPHGGHYAEPAVIYDNVFIVLKDRNLHIEKPDDLKGHTVMAFPGALERYPEWLNAVKKAGNYAEINEQALQVKVLYNGRYDVVLSDRYIFRYYAKLLEQERKILPHKTIEYKFGQENPDNYRAIFRNKSIADDYDAGLKAMKKSGRYKAILDQYLK